MIKELWTIREEVRERKPLVLNLTNNVVTNFTANILLAAGASPIMSEGILEAEDLIRISNVLVLNIGTLHSRQVDYFLKAGEIANKLNKPIVLDPVATGATNYRSDITTHILKELKLSLIRGNYGEISWFKGISGATKGVDSLASEVDLKAIKDLALQTGIMVSATGQTDYISDGERVFYNKTGHEMLQLITGTGCALSSLMGAFISVSEDSTFGALSALAFYGACAEKASRVSNGPGSFSINFIDAIYNLKQEEFTEITAGKVGISK